MQSSELSFGFSLDDWLSLSLLDTYMLAHCLLKGPKDGNLFLSEKAHIFTCQSWYVEN